jgi:serine/threonine-protein kinase
MTVTGEVVGEAVAAPQTITAGAAGANAAAPVSEPVAPPSMPEFEVVRAAGSEPRIEGADVNAINRAAFVNVADVIAQPTSPRLTLAVAAVLLLAALIAGALMFKEPDRSGTLRRAEVRVASVDLSQARMVNLDTSKDLPVRTSGRLAGADHATLELSSAGIPLAKLTAKMSNGRGEFRTNAARYLAAGSVKGRVTVERKGKELAHQEFPLSVSRGWYLTAFGIGSLLVALAGLAYLESSLRPLRRGRRRVVSFVGCGISAAVLAVGVCEFLAAAGAAWPTGPALVVVGLCCAAAGISFGMALRRAALRKGIRRAVQRAGRAYAAAPAS